MEGGVRRQIASALDFLVQSGRRANGKRRIISITEVTGMGDGVISTQELYRHESYVGPDGDDNDRWVSLGIHPHTPKLASMRTKQRHGSSDAEEAGGHHSGGRRRTGYGAGPWPRWRWGCRGAGCVRG